MISVCIATFNGEKYIHEQLVSILQQLGTNDEIIISDDSSTDNTIKMIHAINDKRIKIYHNNVRNPIQNFENALRKAQGKYIFLSDQDDIWLETKISITIEHLQKYDLVVHDAVITDENLAILQPSLYQLINSKKGLLHNIKKSTYYGACMAFHKRILQTALPFPPTKEIGHDLWLGLVAELIGEVIFIEEKLIKYRRHKNSFTPTGYGKSKRNYFAMLRGRLIMLREILKFQVNKKS